MAIGGRSTAATWIVGMIVLAVIAGIVWIALPSLHLVGDWIAGAVQYFFDWLRSITPEPA